MYLHVHACICACMLGSMNIEEHVHGFHTYIDVCAHACVTVHFCNIPPQVLKLASLPPPLPNIEKLPTHMSQAAILGSPFQTQNYFTFIP